MSVKKVAEILILALGAGIALYLYFKHSRKPPESRVVRISSSSSCPSRKKILLCPSLRNVRVSFSRPSRHCVKVNTTPEISEISDTTCSAMSSAPSKVSIVKSAEELIQVASSDKFKELTRSMKCMLCCKGQLMHITRPDHSTSLLCLTVVCPRCKKVSMVSDKDTDLSAKDVLHHFKNKKKALPEWVPEKKSGLFTKNIEKPEVNQKKLMMYQHCSNCCKDKEEDACKKESKVIKK